MKHSTFGLFVAALALAAACSDTTAVDAGSDAGIVMDASGFDAATRDSGAPDAGPPPDADTSLDADTPSDADTPRDAGSDAGAGDSGAGDSGTADAGAGDAGRTVVTGSCVRTFGTCSVDTDCMPGGCGGEVCASADISSTCDCTSPTASCGCIAGSCAWYR
jgi:hypothetical protein